MLALYTLATNPKNNELNTAVYMKAGGEATAFVISTCWVISYLCNPAVFENNPLKERLGYNNPCVGLDTKPATFFASAMLTVPIYLNFRACWIAAMAEAYAEDNQTTTIGRIMTYASCLIYMVSTAILAVLFLVPPGPTASDCWWHTSIYVQYILGRLIFVTTHYYRHGNQEGVFQNGASLSWCFLHVYAAVSILAPVLFYVNFAWYDIYRDPAVDGDKILIPWYVTMTVDYLWFICLALTTKFMPQSSAFVLERQQNLRDEFEETFEEQEDAYEETVGLTKS